MADVALIWDPVNGRADFAIQNGDLVMDSGLQTAVIISLFCDRSADRRGWWADTPLPGVSDPAGGIDLTGSRLWLLARALQTQDTLNKAQAYARECLQWMITDGIAGSIEVQAAYPVSPPNALEMVITINQVGAASPALYAFAWAATPALSSPPTPGTVAYSGGGTSFDFSIPGDCGLVTLL